MWEHLDASNAIVAQLNEALHNCYAMSPKSQSPKKLVAILLQTSVDFESDSQGKWISDIQWQQWKKLKGFTQGQKNILVAMLVLSLLENINSNSLCCFSIWTSIMD